MPLAHSDYATCRKRTRGVLIPNVASKHLPSEGRSGNANEELLARQKRAVDLFMGPPRARQEHALGRGAELRSAQQPAGNEEERRCPLLPFGTAKRSSVSPR